MSASERRCGVLSRVNTKVSRLRLCGRSRMGVVLIDTYKGENPGNFTNPPVNEVLVASMDAAGNQVSTDLTSFQVSLLQPSPVRFVVTAVVSDGPIVRVKLAVNDGTDFPLGLNLGYVSYTHGNDWGIALCSINLTNALTIIPVFPQVFQVNPDGGTIGSSQKVVITGVGFTNAYLVTFGGDGSGINSGGDTPAFSVDSFSQITVPLSPSNPIGGPGTVDVYVSTPKAT